MSIVLLERMSSKACLGWDIELLLLLAGAQKLLRICCYASVGRLSAGCRCSAGNYSTVAATGTNPHTATSRCSHVCLAILQALWWAAGTIEGYLLCAAPCVQAAALGWHLSGRWPRQPNVPPPLPQRDVFCCSPFLQVHTDTQHRVWPNQSSEKLWETSQPNVSLPPPPPQHHILCYF